MCTNTCTGREEGGNDETASKMKDQKGFCGEMYTAVQDHQIKCTGKYFQREIRAARVKLTSTKLLSLIQLRSI